MVHYEMANKAKQYLFYISLPPLMKAQVKKIKAIQNASRIFALKKKNNPFELGDKVQGSNLYMHL